jgi:hypothetical protein
MIVGVPWKAMECSAVELLLTHQSRFRPLAGVIHMVLAWWYFKSNAQVSRLFTGGRVFVWMDVEGAVRFLYPVGCCLGFVDIFLRYFYEAY